MRACSDFSRASSEARSRRSYSCFGVTPILAFSADTLSENSRVASLYDWSSLLLSSQPAEVFNEAGTSQSYLHKLKPGSSGELLARARRFGGRALRAARPEPPGTRASRPSGNDPARNRSQGFRDDDYHLKRWENNDLIEFTAPAR
jgi:hypothetical protein